MTVEFLYDPVCYFIGAVLVAVVNCCFTLSGVSRGKAEQEALLGGS